MTRPPLPAPLLLPASGDLPVLLSVPHSGTAYPDWLIAEARRGVKSLEPLEDPLVDRLVWRAVALGCPAVIARTPRAAIDCNRGLEEVDRGGLARPGAVPEAENDLGSDPGPRARAGLGLIPERTPRDGDLWRRRLTNAEIALRTAEAWEPYHRAVATELAALHTRFGTALLLDCHSMPPLGVNQPQLVLGDRHGRSAARWLGDRARLTVERSGFKAVFNDPYAGGAIVAQHGAPGRRVHALQIEVDRSAYLDRTLRRPGAGFDECARLIETLARTLGEALIEARRIPLAAE